MGPQLFSFDSDLETENKDSPVHTLDVELGYVGRECVGSDWDSGGHDECWRYILDVVVQPLLS